MAATLGSRPIDRGGRFRDAVAATPEMRPVFPGLVGSTSETNDAGASGRDGGAKPLLQSGIPAAPTLSLPKGGGAIQGMGEKFAV